MANSIYLSLVFHNHQPVGNFDFVNEHSYKVAYEPIVSLLERFPGVKLGLHFSGSLLDWLRMHHPELLERLKVLVARNQVEILTGGYYEPILPALPDDDKIGQIRKLTDTVAEIFGTEPSGMWLAERVWDPYLAKPLSEAGVRYIILDDTHFEGVGLDKNRDLFGYFITEEQGHTLAVFPSLTHLRYSIPWSMVADNINWLRQQADETLPNLQPKLAFMGDDGEKFGVWPGTYQHCWQNGYMDRLFSALDENSEWLRTTTPGEYMAEFSALGRIYLPTGSYMEMGEWSLPPAKSYHLKMLRQSLQDEGNYDLLRFLRGGIWRNFMVKYEEINHMQKRTLHVSQAVHKMPDGPDKEAALDYLWRAQGNDAYWHGLFGGIYLFHFRITNYANLIAAELLAEGQDHPLMVRKFDLDMDSNDEVVLSGDKFYFVWDLARGGALREWDYRPAHYNLLNLVTRRDEGYHQDLISAVAENRILIVGREGDYGPEGMNDDIVRVKEPGMENYLIGDWYRRGAFIDHFLRDDTTLDGFYRSAYPEQGDCVILPYEVDWSVNGNTATVALRRDARVWVGEAHMPVRVEKTFRVEQGSQAVHVQYRLKNQAEQSVRMRFAVETALAYDAGDNSAHCAFVLDERNLSLFGVAEHRDVMTYGAVTKLRQLKTETRLSKPAHLWRFPLETVTISEAGFERRYQGTVFLQWWSLEFQPGEEWEVEIVQEVSELA